MFCTPTALKGQNHRPGYADCQDTKSRRHLVGWLTAALRTAVPGYAPFLSCERRARTVLRSSGAGPSAI
jgi:hypothetical protein